MKYILYIILFIFININLVIAEDWNEPGLGSNYTDVLAILKDRDESLARMDFSSSVNYPDGSIRWNVSSNRFEIFNGSAWLELWPEVNNHIDSSDNPHNLTASNVGAASEAALSSHVATTNPHNITTSQIGALSKTSNLSDVNSTSQARTNLGVVSLSAFNVHANNKYNPHDVTASQVGAASKSLNLSDLSNKTTARNNLIAAKSGSNSDITQLNKVTTVTNNTADLTLRTTSTGDGLNFQPGSGSVYAWHLNAIGKLSPTFNRTPNYTTWPGWTTEIRSIDPSSATAQDCANALNTVYKDLMSLGFFR